MSAGEARAGGRRFHRLPPKEDVERELSLHLALREEELIAAGWDAAAARAEAQRLFGDYRAIRRECGEIAERHARSTRRTRMWSELGQDIRYALRWLKREPGFALLAICTLALGIGANSAAFGIVNGVLLTPLPYPEPDRLVTVAEVTERGSDVAVTWPNFRDWEAQARTVSAIAAYQQPWPATVLGGTEAVRAGVSRVSGGFFDVFGVQPARGRTFTADELVVGGPAAVLVSDAFWRAQLGSRTDLTALTLQLQGYAVQVVGVMPPTFDFPRATDIWYPVDREGPSGLGDRTAHNFRVVARLAPGAAIESAERELTRITERIRETGEPVDALAARVTNLREYSVGSARQPLLLLLGASAFVLLVACTNLASALLARAARRRHELAIRASLGAHRLRLVRQLLTESVLLAALGAIAGLGFAHLLLRVALAVGPDSVPRLHDVRLDAWVLAFTTVLAMATALTFGTAPALRATTAQPYDALRGGGRGTESPGQRRVWSLLVGAEVALALLLLVGSGLLIRSFYRLTQEDPGFDPDRQLAVQVSLPGTKYSDPMSRVRFFEQLLENVRALPGVENAAVTMSLPLVGFDPNGLFDIEGGELGEGDAHYRLVSPGFFETMRTPVVRGRGFTNADAPGAADVIVINEAMARTFFADADPIGRRMRTGGMDSRGLDFATIVGVVGDVRHRSLDTPPAPAYYLTYAQRTDRILNMTLLVRSGGSPRALADPVRRTIRTLDADVAIEVETLRSRIGESLAGRRFMMLVLGVFAGIALALAGVGIYGVVSFAVAQRTREIGIRKALGAASGGVLWAVSRNTMVSVGAGIAVGLIGAAALSRLFASMLYEVQPFDPLTFAAVALLLVAIAWLAVLIPARRATRVSPMAALRTE